MTAWKSHGSQFLVRENGVPKGTLVTNAQLVARYVPDLLPSVLPLVIHEQPQRVLLLGLRAGEPLAATTAFPVQRVLCLEADRGVLGLCRVLMGGSADVQRPLTPDPSPRRGEGRNSGSPTPFDDDRVEARVREPVVAVRTLHEKFDVVISSPDQPSLPQAAVWFTDESLRAAASCLENEGVFAIRFQHIDLGPRSVRVLAKTLSAIFREVAAVEIGSGELLFLGTNSERGFAREGFVERLQRPHVRHVLASMGWDWSTPLRLGLQDADAIGHLTNHKDAEVNVCSRSTWPFRLPLDVMRWQNKRQQTRELLAQHERFLMTWGGDKAESVEVATRLSEWDLSRQIVSRHADE
ncbi:MAG TPA: hypothetical protein VK137_09650, partial [Planctomycetaceae bacterium]|nr:hypothetical protein [Planctomycetaceae bacterium]